MVAIDFLLVEACLAGLCLATSSTLDRKCLVEGAASQIFRQKPVCGHLRGLDPTTGYGPWTHQPLCRRGTNSKTKTSQEYCIFTKANHTSQRGFSIFTTPDLADEAARLSNLAIYDEVGSINISPPYEKRKLPGRGIGLVAARDISIGETVMRDAPTLVLNSEGLFHVEHDDRHELLWRGLMQLPEESQKLIHDLATSQGGDLVDDIAHTNGVGIEIGKGRPYGAVMPELSRINHSCRPNAFYRFNAKKMLIEVLALRDIKKGEELLISYTMTAVPTKLRKNVLRGHWGFDCKCEVCSASEERINESDMRVMFIMEAKKAIDSGKTDPRTTLELASEILDLYDQEGLVTPKAEFYLIAAKAASELGDLEAAQRFIKQATFYWMILAGEDSDELREAEKFAHELLGRYRSS